MPVQIEPAAEVDAPEILALIQEYFSYVNMDFDALLRRMRYPWIYIEKSVENGVLTGFSDWEIIDKKNRVVRLNGIATKPAYRGKGHAVALLESGETWAKKKGMKTLTLFVSETNAPAKQLYEQSGYTKMGLHLKKINGNVSEVWEKDLE